MQKSLAISSIVLIVFVLIYLWIKLKFSYWKDQNIPYLKPSFPWGNLTNPLVSPKPSGQVFQEFYNKNKEKGLQYAGFYMFTEPLFVPINPDLIKNILIKDSNKFNDRGFYNNEKDQPISASLFTVDGFKWRILRYKLSPVFTSGKIKSMYKLIVDCTPNLNRLVLEKIQQKEAVNMKDVLSRYSVDTVGSCAFGINCNSYTKNPEIYHQIDKMVKESTGFLRFAFLNTFPKIGKILKMGLFTHEAAKYFTNIFTATFEERIRNGIRRGDFLDLMRDIHEKKNGEDFDFTVTEMLAESLVFLLGGYETSSTALTFLFYELSMNQDIQEKLRREIFKISKKYDRISYEALNEMKYLQCVIYETLRKYPSVTTLERVSTENYQLPDGKMINANTRITVPIFAIQRDSEFYPNPELFYPERFSDENKTNLTRYTYFPFGDGPRNCIGSRFALIQMKVAVSHLLTKYRFRINENMKLEENFASHFVLKFTQDVLLDAEEI